MEGYPGFDEALRRLKERHAVRRVELRPLMVVAGDHAKNDLAGDEPDSWKSMLEAEGYQVSCVLRGLGRTPACGPCSPPTPKRRKTPGGGLLT